MIVAIKIDPDLYQDDIIKEINNAIETIHDHSTKSISNRVVIEQLIEAKTKRITNKVQAIINAVEENIN